MTIISTGIKVAPRLTLAGYFNSSCGEKRLHPTGKNRVLVNSIHYSLSKAPDDTLLTWDELNGLAQKSKAGLALPFNAQLQNFIAHSGGKYSYDHPKKCLVIDGLMTNEERINLRNCFVLGKHQSLIDQLFLRPRYCLEAGGDVRFNLSNLAAYTQHQALLLQPRQLGKDFELILSAAAPRFIADFSQYCQWLCILPFLEEKGSPALGFGLNEPGINYEQKRNLLVGLSPHPKAQLEAAVNQGFFFYPSTMSGAFSAAIHTWLESLSLVLGKVIFPQLAQTKNLAPANITNKVMWGFAYTYREQTVKGFIARHARLDPDLEQYHQELMARLALEQTKYFTSLSLAEKLAIEKMLT